MNTFCGANSYGQLGLGYKCEQLLSPKELPLELNEKIIQISGGAGHSLILTDSGSVYSTGLNTKGQLGYKTDIESLTFKKITLLEQYKIVQISSGWDFSAAITENGNVFVWGSNNFLQLGLDKNVKWTPKPLKLSVENIRYVSCGMRHMALITKNGNIMTCGSGNKGQLGFVSNSRESTIQLIPDLEDFTSISCGQHHTVALSCNGNVFIWGDNKYGQLGLDPNEYKTIPTPQKLDLNALIKNVYTGWTHTALVTKQGEIYNFGRNIYGQLGEERNICWLPKKLQGVGRVKLVCLGSEHNLCIDSKNELLSWGWNEHGNCGTGDVVDKKYPTKILLNEIKYVSAGTGQSFAVI